jgi:phage shock protein E
MTMTASLVSRIALPLLVVAVAFSSGCSNAQTEKKAGPILKDVSNAEFQKLMTSLEGALLLDVRTPDEWNEGHLPGAAHADYWGDEKAFEEAMNSIPRDRPVLVYCAGGGRSGLTAKELVAAGHKEVYNLENGISGWERDGLPVVTGPPSDF